LIFSELKAKTYPKRRLCRVALDVVGRQNTLRLCMPLFAGTPSHPSQLSFAIPRNDNADGYDHRWGKTASSARGDLWPKSGWGRGELKCFILLEPKSSDTSDLRH